MAQDYPQEKYEVIVIDDLSSDSTPEIVRELQRQCSNLVFARNAGSGTAVLGDTVEQFTVWIGIRQIST